MPFYVYILFSAKADKYYVGQTKNIEDRLFRHNNSGSKFTRFTNDWKLVYSESFPNRSEAIRRESEIKVKRAKNLLSF